MVSFIFANTTNTAGNQRQGACRVVVCCFVVRVAIDSILSRGAILSRVKSYAISTTVAAQPINGSAV